MKNKWAETGINICNQAGRSWKKEMWFPFRKAKYEPSVTPKEKKTRSQRAEEKQPWTVDGWMKVMFRDESPRRRCWNSSLVQWNIERWLTEENQLISTITGDMGLMSGGGPGEMAAITSTVSVQVDSDTLDTFCLNVINQKEVWWCWAHFQGDNTSQDKESSDFPSERRINSTTWTENSLDLHLS